MIRSKKFQKKLWRAICQRQISERKPLRKEKQKVCWPGRAFLLEKKLYNLRSLYSSGLVDFLVQELSNPAIILFGSYARGEDVETSDIDIFIETTQKEIPSLVKFEKKLQRKTQLFKYKDISKVENKELSNNIINGITLNGFLEVFK